MFCQCHYLQMYRQYSRYNIQYGIWRNAFKSYKNTKQDSRKVGVNSMNKERWHQNAFNQIGYIFPFTTHRNCVEPIGQMFNWDTIIPYRIVEKLFHILQQVQTAIRRIILLRNFYVVAGHVVLVKNARRHSGKSRRAAITPLCDVTANESKIKIKGCLMGSGATIRIPFELTTTGSLGSKI
uniref:Uncharacterized protein n=1 Tax=Glossina palpalis gambiensis TaxID=67801 RepID=A0A1B0BTQ9_9MUSC